MFLKKIYTRKSQSLFNKVLDSYGFTERDAEMLNEAIKSQSLFNKVLDSYRKIKRFTYCAGDGRTASQSLFNKVLDSYGEGDEVEVVFFKPDVAIPF